MRLVSIVGAALLVLSLGILSFGSVDGATAEKADRLPRAFPQGIASGEITPHSAILWTRTADPARLWLEVSEQSNISSALRMELETTAESDHTVQATVGDLVPGTRYYYRFVDRSDGATSEIGTFTAAPAPSDEALPRFVVGGDVGGQAYCRTTARGYSIFSAMAELQPDFFIANGDMIYADNDCPPENPEGEEQIPGDFPPILAADWSAPGVAREAILGHWRYNRADPHQRRLLAQTPVFAQWDDHEVINDFGAPWPEYPMYPEREGYQDLVRAGKDALFQWNPMPRHPEEPQRIYRSFQWGRDLDVFLLDARSYRSANDLPDTPAHQKTMLGQEQLAWLKKGLKESSATWKIVSSDVPLSIPTGWQPDLWGRDAFANGEGDSFRKRTGFERELRDLLTFFDTANIRNIVFVVTDVHFAANLRYDIDLDGDGDRLLFHELISGPLNAYKLPVPPGLDPSFRPIILYAEGGLFNFSHIRLVRSDDGKTHLTADVRDHEGNVRFGSRLELTPE